MKDIREGIEEFESKKNEVRRFPAILLVAEDIEAYREIIKVLYERARPITRSDLKTDPLADFTKNLRDILRSSKGLYFLPWISPVIWLRASQGAFIRKLLSMEVKGKSMVFLPLIGLTSEALNTIEFFKKREKPRRKSDIVYYFRKSEKKLKVYYLRFEPVDGRHFKNVSELLETFENENVEDELYIAFDLKKEFISGVEYRRIENLKDFLEIKGVSVPVEYYEKYEDHWQKLMKEIRDESFKEYAFEVLNIRRFDLDVFDKWDGGYKSWLIHALLRETDDFSLLKKLSLEADDFMSFEKKLWMIPFGETLKPGDFEIRRSVLKRMRSAPPTEYLEKLENELKTPDTFVGVGEERPLIVEWVGNHLDDIPPEELIGTLRKIYPELSSYMKILFLNDVPDYFKKYVIAKLKNDLSVLANAEFEPIFKSRDGILSNSDSKKVYIDGMGVEWIGYIVDKLGDVVSKYEIARANLPTTSEFNEIPEAEEISERQLDEVLHENLYPHNIVESLEIMKDMVEKIKRMLKEFGELILTSDHGFTAFVGREKIDLPLGAEPKRYGRYAETPSGCSDTEEYLCVDNKFLVTKTHKSFKSKGRPHGEVHGGATPEEMYVPVLFLSVRTENVEFEVRVLNEKVMKFDRLRISIRPPDLVKKVVLECEDVVISGTRKRDERDVFEFDVQGLSSGKKKCNVVVNDSRSYKVELEISKGFEEEELI